MEIKIEIDPHAAEETPDIKPRGWCGEAIHALWQFVSSAYETIHLRSKSNNLL